MLRKHLGIRSAENGSRWIDAVSLRHISLDGPLRQSLGILAVSTIAALAIVAIDQTFKDAGQNVVVQNIDVQDGVVNVANKGSPTASASFVRASVPESTSNSVAYSPAPRQPREALRETAGAGATETNGRADQNARSGPGDSQFFQRGDSPPEQSYRTVRSVAVTALTAPPAANVSQAQQAIEAIAPQQAARPMRTAPDRAMENEPQAQPETAEKPRAIRTSALETSAKSPASSSRAPIECLPEPLKNVLADLQSRFPDVTIVQTTHVHTQNHWPKSARETMHTECKAVDVKTGSPKDVLSYLRSRSEVGGTNSYRAGVIHFDLNPQFKAVASQGSRRS